MTLENFNQDAPTRIALKNILGDAAEAAYRVNAMIRNDLWDTWSKSDCGDSTRPDLYEDMPSQAEFGELNKSYAKFVNREEDEWGFAVGDADNAVNSAIEKMAESLMGDFDEDGPYTLSFLDGVALAAWSPSDRRWLEVHEFDFSDMDDPNDEELLSTACEEWDEFEENIINGVEDCDRPQYRHLLR